MKRKTMMIGGVIAVTAIAAALLVQRLSKPREATMLLVNGVVYTLDDRHPRAEAVAMEGGRIVGVGSTKEMEASFRSGKIIDLGGRPVYPGFIDSHLHMEQLGAALAQVDLAGTRSVEEIRALLKDRVRLARPGSWIRGRGWDQNRWPGEQFPTHRMLDDLAPDNPVFFGRIDGHAVWVNKKVMDIAGISRLTPDPPGGKIVRDAHGEPTGVFIDNAMKMLVSVLPEPSRPERLDAIRAAVHECVAMGLTEAHDMGVDPDLIDVYKDLIAQGEFPFRVYVAVDGTSDRCDSILAAGPDTGEVSGRLTVRAVKLYADGALGSRGAALVDPYTDDPGNRGLTILSSEQLDQAAEKCLVHGFQLCVHAIGDRANHLVLDAYAGAFRRHLETAYDARFRIEHAQVLDSADIPLFHRLRVLPMMQPTHCTSDMGWVEERLGPARARWAYAWRSLLDDGSIIPASSDAPVESPNPLWGFYAAITREDREGKPAGGWHPGQRMTRQEALKSFTTWGAYAGFQERVKGAIEPGMWADLTILSDDIMTIDPPKILQTKAAMTIVAGNIAYADTTLAPAQAESRQSP